MYRKGKENNKEKNNKHHQYWGIVNICFGSLNNKNNKVANFVYLFTYIKQTVLKEDDKNKEFKL